MTLLACQLYHSLATKFTWALTIHISYSHFISLSIHMPYYYQNHIIPYSTHYSILFSFYIILISILFISVKFSIFSINNHKSSHQTFKHLTSLASMLHSCIYIQYLNHKCTNQNRGQLSTTLAFVFPHDGPTSSFSMINN